MSANPAATPFGPVEAFWAYLQRQLRARGGIRFERLGLYLTEYAWRYGHRELSTTEQLRELMKLLRQSGGRSGTFPGAATFATTGDFTDTSGRSKP